MGKRTVVTKEQQRSEILKAVRRLLQKADRVEVILESGFSYRSEGGNEIAVPTGEKSLTLRAWEYLR